MIAPAFAAEAIPFEKLGHEFEHSTRPLIQQFCTECHSTETQEGEFDLERFATFEVVRSDVNAWQSVAAMLDNGEMPPADANSLSVEQARTLRQWIQRYLDAEALARAGDPGPVVLRRLSNAQYTFTLRDLTGITSLEPTREFPIDGAAGEGFTNTGSALVMSPGLLTKYLDAAKNVAAHAVLVPDGLDFSRYTSRRDWTNEKLHEIRDFYRQHAEPMESSQIALHGLVWESADGGRLPLERYLKATIEHRAELVTGETSPELIAQQSGLSGKYLRRLWDALHETSNRSPVLDPIRTHWRTADLSQVEQLVAEISAWQHALWKFGPVGHIGKIGGPKAWQEPVDPIVYQADVRLKLADNGASEGDSDRVRITLAAGDAGDGHDHDDVIWHEPRFVTAGQPDLLLRDVRAITKRLDAMRMRLFDSVAACLAAAAEVSTSTSSTDLPSLAEKFHLDPELLAIWFETLGLNAGDPVKIDGYFKDQITAMSGYDFVKGWGQQETPNLVTNASDQMVRIPGKLDPHSVVVHPSPTQQAVIGWRSPVATTIRVEGSVEHAHPECGNGVTWSLHLERGSTHRLLATGVAQGAAEVSFDPIPRLAVRPGDLLSLRIGPRDGNHACDLTRVDVKLTEIAESPRVWDLAADVADTVLAGNPHADRWGNSEVWHFFTMPDDASSSGDPTAPADSLLAKWHGTDDLAEKSSLAQEIQQLLTGAPPLKNDASANAQLYRQLASYRGPLLTAARRIGDDHLQAEETSLAVDDQENPWGLPAVSFGRHPDGEPIGAADLCVRAPSTLEFEMPADWVTDSEFVATATLHAEKGAEGSVQVMATTAPRQAMSSVQADLPIMVHAGSQTDQQWQAALAEFRELFPAALCYTRIVPVDEVVTLTLFHREDDQLRRLILDEEKTAQIDHLWDELHYISQDRLTLVDAFEQLWQYATQDADPAAFEPLRVPIYDNAAAFRQRLIDTEPEHVAAVMRFAALAYRRPLGDDESQRLIDLYQQLRQEELDHEQAIRLLLARILVSPAFLYRTENSRPVTASDVTENHTVPPEIPAHRISDWELASRLSYFLWSSLPDEELRRLAADGRLHEPAQLVAQARRMLTDTRVRRLASEFACQWLHIYDFDSHDEKSEATFPTFADLRGDMYEEAIRFFADLFQRDGSVLEILDADHTFLNESLAHHYEIPQVSGTEWRRVDGLKTYGRGGILAMAAILSKQSGASRTSPILRGNWACEVLLGERLPKPPPGVPQLPDTLPTGLTERQLIEQHSNNPACAKCHVRIDPIGFSLEGFDAIGRRRAVAADQTALDTSTTLADGTNIDGLNGLRTYLMTERRDDFVRQFCRKLLGYALGRSIQLSDEPLLEQLQNNLRQNDYRVTVAVETIIQSPQFTHIRATPTHGQGEGRE